LGAIELQERMNNANPHGREETMAALISACERLCNSAPPNLVTVRDVAEEANVTLGLVHHYFESKDALIAATLQSIARDVDAVAAAAYEATHDAGEMVRAVWRVFEKRPAFAVITGWWLLEGKNVTEAMGEHPFMRRLARVLMEDGDADGTTGTAVIATLLIAGTAFGAGMNTTLGRAGDDPLLAARLERVVVDLAQGT
jgi:AcrR family transcriptional regulator